MAMDPLVLIVDDDEDFLDIARDAIGRLRLLADVRLLDDGLEALHVLGLESGSNGPPANLVALFCDLDIPGVSGWEILSRVRAHPSMRNLPVVIVSSSTRVEDIRRSYELGASSYLAKPFDMREPGDHLALAVRYWSVLNRVPWALEAVR